jgi:hypothetical protein
VRRLSDVAAPSGAFGEVGPHHNLFARNPLTDYTIW